MSEAKASTHYDEALLSILVNEKSIIGFLSTIFNFLARRTDFYYVPKSPTESLGFPQGVAEELVVKILRKCDPKNWKWPEPPKVSDITDDVMCSTVAQEVEVVTNEEDPKSNMTNEAVEQIKNVSQANASKPSSPKSNLKETIPPIIPVQSNSESYNGAVRDKYSWSQTITELDVTVTLPPEIMTAKDVSVSINPEYINIQNKKNGTIIIKDNFPHKVKTLESFWTVTGDRLQIHLEKQQERWWKSLLSNEEEIDLSKIDCSRPLNDLPEDHQAKVRELQWNQEQKLRGLPTTEELKNISILKKAWNMEGSPFKGKEFDPSILQH